MENELTDCTRRGFFRLGLGLAASAPAVLASGCESESGFYSPQGMARADAKVAIVACTSYTTSLAIRPLRWLRCSSPLERRWCGLWTRCHFYSRWTRF